MSSLPGSNRPMWYVGGTAAARTSGSSLSMRDPDVLAPKQVLRLWAKIEQDDLGAVLVSCS